MEQTTGSNLPPLSPISFSAKQRPTQKKCGQDKEVTAKLQFAALVIGVIH